MKLKLNTIFSARNCTLFLSVFFAMTLAACGGGNGSGGSPLSSGASGSTGSTGSTGGTGSTTTPTLTMSITSPASGTALAAYASTQITVQVNANGQAYTAQPVTVNFTSACATSQQATLAATATTSASNGQAVVTYTDNGCGKADTVTASVSGGATASVTLNVSPATVAAINFVSINPASASIVFAGTGGTGRSQSAVLTFKVVDKNGNPIGGVPVSFSNNNAALATLGQTTAITQSGTGTVSTSVTAVGANSAGVYPAAGTLAVTATTTSPAVSVSAISSNVIVSTGQPDANAFSMAAASYEVSGIDLFGTTTSVSFFLSDSNGNPVVDGTPVAATTNEGGISGATGSNPGCTTLNGQCKLTFTTQNPIYDVTSAGVTEFGIATVTGTSTNGTSQIGSSIKIYMSGNQPMFYALTGTTTPTPPASPVPLYSVGNGFAYSTGASCSGTFILYLSDQVGNPMASGDTITVAATTTGLTINSALPTSVPVEGFDPSRALTTAATLQNYSSIPLVSNPANPTGPEIPYINEYIYATPIQVELTMGGACSPTGTVNKGSAEFTVSVDDLATNTTTVTPFVVKFPE